MELTLKDRLKEALDKKEPDRETVMQLLAEMKKEELSQGNGDILLGGHKGTPAKAHPVGWKRAAIAAVVALVLILSVPRAFGSKGIFSAVGKWTREIFSFGDNKEKEFVFKTDRPELQELYDIVAEYNLSKNVVPTWIPDDAVLNDMHTQVMPNGIIIFAAFLGADDNYIGIQINVREDPADTEYQKSDGDAILYDRSDIKHYIMANDQKWTAVWTVDNAECTTSANNKEVLYQMLDSIYSLEE